MMSTFSTLYFNWWALFFSLLKLIFNRNTTLSLPRDCLLHSLSQKLHKKAKPHNCNTWAEGTDHSHANSLVCGSVSLSPHEPPCPFTLHVFPWCSMSLWFPDFFFSLSTRFPEDHLMFGCGSVDLFPSVDGGSLSDKNWSRKQCIRIAEYH